MAANIDASRGTHQICELRDITLVCNFHLHGTWKNSSKQNPGRTENLL